MTIEEGFQTDLLSAAAITALVSTRIHFARAPKRATYSHIVWRRLAGPRDQTHSPSTNTLATARMQLSCYGKTPEEAVLVAKAVVDRYDDRTGFMGTVPGTASSIADERDHENEEQKLGLYRRDVDVMITYQETVG